jgi:hypothetical protein
MINCKVICLLKFTYVCFLGKWSILYWKKLYLLKGLLSLTCVYQKKFIGESLSKWFLWVTIKDFGSF